MVDTYTKVVLTIIAVFLGAIAVQGAIRPAVGQYGTDSVRIENTRQLARHIASAVDGIGVYCNNC
jgi:hypothetical protein|tara:strand:+ start:338 stop:532 length:195 start_codon:yes stop_codon:yes gene_type:complete